MHHAFKVGEDEHDLWLSRGRDGYVLHSGDRLIPVAFKREDDGHCFVTTGDVTTPVVVAVRGDDVFVHVDGETHQLSYRHPMVRLAASGQGSAEDVIRAPMPGSLVALKVKDGETVQRGDPLLVMESMKMETTIAAPRDAVVEAVHVGVGQTFDRDAVLITFQSEAAKK